MRRFRALAFSAALEALAEPLSAVIFLVASATIHLAPVFHYHQFGEAGRLARECGFSALLVFGLVFATSAAIRAIGGEISSGTAAVALARPVSRTLFFCAKLCGVISSFLLFAIAIAAATLLATYSSQHGANVADCCEGSELSRFWQPGFRIALTFTILAFALAAVANRFFRSRFCVTACVFVSLAQPLALLCSFPFVHGGTAAVLNGFQWQIAPALAVLASGCIVFVIMSGSLAIRLKPAPAVALVSCAVVSSFVYPVKAIVPEISRFWLADGLAAGSSIAWGDAIFSVAGAICLSLFWLMAGAILFRGKELS